MLDGAGMILEIREAQTSDEGAILTIIMPIIRAGETYALPRDMSDEEALGYWTAPAKTTFVAGDKGEVIGTYTLAPNQQGGGAHVANCSFMVAAEASGKGVARAMCEHALETARERGYRAMQFNFVVATNTRAIALWEGMGFAIAGRLQRAFEHPALGFVDALIMYQEL